MSCELVAALLFAGGAPPPITPTGVTVESLNGRNILRWSTNAINVYHHIYWSNSPGVTPSNGTRITLGQVQSYEHAGLGNGTAYYYVITSSNSYGESAPSAQVSGTPNSNPPGAPGGITAAAGNGRVTLSWNAVQGADSYKLYWSDTSGAGTGGTAVAVPGTSYTLLGLTNGQHYYFVVTALNGASEGATSGQVCATPWGYLVSLAAPTGVSASAGNQAAQISWSAVSGAEHYRIYVNNSGGVTKSNATAIDAASSPKTLTGLTNNLRYYFAVAAVATGGESDLSAEVNATPTGGSGSVGPVITGLTPAAVTAGGADFTLVVAGDRFVSGATVLSNGTAHASTYVSGQRIDVPVLAAEIATAGSVSIVVRNPDLLQSAAATFIVAPVPALTGFLNLPASLKANETVRVVSSGMATFNWTLTFQSELGAPAVGNSGRAPAAAPSVYNATTASGELSLASVNPAPGNYTISVGGANAAGLAVTPISANVTLLPAALENVRAYPNPWRADKSAQPAMTFDRLPSGAVMKIFTISGKWVRTLTASGTGITWDLKSDDGDPVASGTYIYTIVGPEGDKKTGRVGVLR